MYRGKQIIIFTATLYSMITHDYKYVSKKIIIIIHLLKSYTKYLLKSLRSLRADMIILTYFAYHDT